MAELISWWEGRGLSFAWFVADEGARVRIFSTKGKEQKIPAARVGWKLGRKAPADATQRGAALTAVIAEIEEQAAAIEVPELWELTHAEEQPLMLEALAGLALAAEDGFALAVCARALLLDGDHFFRDGDGWSAATPEALEELREKRRRAEAKRRDRENWEQALQQLAKGAEFVSTGGDAERHDRNALWEVVLREEMADDTAQRSVREMLRLADVRHERIYQGAFRLLCRLGEIEDETINLAIPRYGLHERFDDEVLALARERVEQPLEAERRDLTELEVYSVDDPSTEELDDLIGVEAVTDGWRVTIHIADPSAFSEIDDAIDRAALERGVTHYFPDRRLPMLPPEISCDAASLRPGEQRPALSFLIDVAADGSVSAAEIVRATVRSRERLSYEELDQRVASGEAAWQAWDAWARARQSWRLERGAIELRSDDIDVKCAADGSIELVRLAADSAARRAVSEAMVLVGQVAAETLRDAAVPTIFRRQAPPDSAIESPVEGAVAIRATRRRLKRAEPTRHVASHAALGLDAYTQVTSPLRRYQDWIVQRQLIAHVSGRPLPYDDEAIDRLLATSDPLERQARRAERESNLFWLLRWYQQRVGETHDGIVVETHPRPVVQLIASGREQPAPALKEVGIGETVRMKIDRVAPRAGILGLRRA